MNRALFQYLSDIVAEDDPVKRQARIDDVPCEWRAAVRCELARYYAREGQKGKGVEALRECPRTLRPMCLRLMGQGRT